MTNYRKNIMVGLTVLLSLVLLGFMIIKFGDAPARLFSPSRVPVVFLTTRADGLSVGSGVYYKGVSVGTVESIALSDDQRTVLIHALVSPGRLPANGVAQIRSQLVGGGSTISVEVPEGQPPEGKVAAQQRIRAEFLGVSVLPPAISDLAASLKEAVEEFRRSEMTRNVNETIKSVRGTADATTRLLGTAQAMVDDPKMREDLRATLANVRSATESADRIGKKLERASDRLDAIGKSAEALSTHATRDVDELTRHLADRLEQVSKILATVQGAVDKVNTGQGTAARLLNDAKLYEELVDVSKELASTVREVKVLVQQIQAEGFHFRLGGK